MLYSRREDIQEARVAPLSVTPDLNGAVELVDVSGRNYYAPSSLEENNTTNAKPNLKTWLWKIPNHTNGVYIIRSVTNRRYYRLGMFANGLRKRLYTTHAGPAVPADRITKDGTPNPPNQTELLRPWLPIFICALEGGDKTVIRLAEIVLEFGIAEHFPLSDQSSEGSMFLPADNLIKIKLPVIVKRFEIAFKSCALAVGKQISIAGFDLEGGSE